MVHVWWWSGVVVSTLASINKVNLRRARLVRRWATVTGFNSRCRTLPNSAFHPSGVGKWVPALAGKAKAGMVHSISWCTQGVQVKLWGLLRMRAIPEGLRGVIMTRRYTNSLLLCLTLPYLGTFAKSSVVLPILWHCTESRHFSRVILHSYLILFADEFLLLIN